MEMEFEPFEPWHNGHCCAVPKCTGTASFTFKAFGLLFLQLKMASQHFSSSKLKCAIMKHPFNEPKEYHPNIQIDTISKVLLRVPLLPVHKRD